MTQEQKVFLIGQVLANSIGAAFQHAGVYDGKLGDMDSRKSDLRNDLRDRLITLGKEYQNSVSETDHCQVIVELADDLTAKHKKKGCLRGDRFRIGITQKALNLYLKYLWCLGEIGEPPHCPIDRRIINVLGIPWNRRGSYDWTKLDDIGKYKELILMCKRQAGGSMSVAEWELGKWMPQA